MNNKVSNKQISLEQIIKVADYMEDYKEKWDKDSSGDDRHPFKALFFAWYNVYRNDKLYDYEKPSWLIELQEKEHLDEGQCLWYYEKWLQLDQDLDMLRQEFPSNPVEAFITTGNSVFNVELLRKRKEELLKVKPVKRGFYTFKLEFSQDGKKIDVKNIQFVESRTGAVKIYKEVEDGHPYVIVNDPANGGEDYFATQVFDNYTGKQVAVYHRNKVDIDDAAYQMHCLGKYYNNALLSGETNTTSYILEMLYKMGNRFIYQDQDVEDLSGRYINKFGYKTKINNRQWMIDQFKIAFREDPSIINDYETICEMESFQVIKHANGKEKVEATGDSHDDLVMACCGFYLCRGAQTAVVKKTLNSKPTTLEELEFKVERNRNKNNESRRVYQIWD